MKYKIEITTNSKNEDIIEEIYFNNLQELQRFYYNIDKKRELQIKYRGYILRSYIMFESNENIWQEEIRKYFKIFPDNPSKYTYSGSVINNINFREIPKNNEKIGNIFKILGTIAICILLFPVMIIIAAVNNK